MIKLSNIQRYSKEVVSNPIKSIKRVFSMITKPNMLETSPVADTLVKIHPQNYILGSSPKKMLEKLTAGGTSSIGKDAGVFAIPNHENLVLRVEHSAMEKISSLSDEMKLIPIKHSETVLGHENLGLPLYSVVDKNSALYGRESITPLEALKQKDNIMVLKKVTGKHPVQDTFDNLMKLMGIAEGEPNVPQYINFHQLSFIRANYGKDAVDKTFNIIKKGGEQNIPKDFFFPGSDEFTFVNCDTFIENHKNYVDSLLTYMKDVSKLPKESFKEAVDTILMKKNFLIDFQHTNNTFVDLKNKKFNFMDFEFDKTNTKYIYENPVKEFRNVIIGKCFSKKVKRPESLLFDEKDYATWEKYAKKITEKVNSVTPDEFKFI